MMRACGGLAALLLLAAAPAAAAIVSRPGVQADADAAAVRAAAARGQAGDCNGVLGLLDPLVVRLPVTSATRLSAQLLRMPCLASAGRGAEVPAVLAEVRTRAPNHPLVRGFQVFDDMAAGRAAQAADGLAALADTGSSALTLMPGSLWRALAQRLTITHDTARRDRTALALARAGWVPDDQPDLGEALAVQGIGALLDEQDVDQAQSLLSRVTRPGALWAMAIERRYEPLWPRIEARLGPAGGTAADRYARTALDAFATAPDDDHARLNAVRAFAALGRAPDVAATARAVTVAPGMNEDRVETVALDAEAMVAAGDVAGAIARLTPFATLDLAKTPQAASALIALGEAEQEGGRYADELALARRLLAVPNSPFSPFGAAWLRRSEACALAGLGDRAGEARAAGDALKAAAGDNEAAAVEGLLCLGRDEEAAAIAVQALGTPEGVDRLADQFQPGEALYLPHRSRLRAMWARLLERKPVRAAFDRAGRILPRALWPSPAPRALPAPATAGPTT